MHVRKYIICMNVCMHVCVYTCMLYACMHVCMYACMYACIMCIHISMYVCQCVPVCVCVCVCACVCVCVCVRVCARDVGHTWLKIHGSQNLQDNNTLQSLILYYNFCYILLITFVFKLTLVSLEVFNQLLKRMS